MTVPYIQADKRTVTIAFLDDKRVVHIITAALYRIQKYEGISGGEPNARRAWQCLGSPEPASGCEPRKRESHAR
jgi:hypothetical protein